MTERVVIVAPSWVGDAILSEPLVALLRAAQPDLAIDVLAPPWCAPVYARMRGIGRIIENPIGHGSFDWAGRRAIARTLRAHGYARAIVLPNSWKSALAPWLAGIARRTGYLGEARWGLLNDVRKLDRRGHPRLVERFAALAPPGGRARIAPPAPTLVADGANLAAATAALGLSADPPVALLCPGAEYGPAKRWPPAHFASLAAKFLADGMQVWLVGSPNDKPAAAAVLEAAGDAAPRIRDLAGRTDLGTAIDLLSLGRLVVTNDSGLMHAAAAIGTPLVALFGSSSPDYTPPLSPVATVARIDIACSPCFKRECPLGHFRCMRDLHPEAVYDRAHAALASAGAAASANPSDTPAGTHGQGTHPADLHDAR